MKHQMKRPWRLENWMSEASQEKRIKRVYQHAAELMKGGLPAAKTEENLVEEGLEPELAASVIDHLQALRRTAGKKKMLYGAIFFFGGLIVTGVTYSMATEGEGYIIAGGAIIFGVIQFVRGWLQSEE